MNNHPRIRDRALPVALAAAATMAAVAVSARQQPPRFSSSVEVTSIDVTVIDDRGRPIESLAPADFMVRVDGKDRRVVSAEWVPLVTQAKATTAFVPEGYRTNENAAGGRLSGIGVG